MNITPNVVMAFLALCLAMVIFVRVICVVYRLSIKTHSKGKGHFVAFGYSYVAVGAAAACAVAGVSWSDPVWSTIMAKAAAWLFLVGSVGLIIFDRRPRGTCDDQKRTSVGSASSTA